MLEAVYGELRAMARQRMQGERSGHTLDATALVHEAYVRLSNDNAVTWQTRGHFFAAAAEAMRRVLIDHARKRSAGKRGGGNARATIDVAQLIAPDGGDDPGLPA